MIRIKRIELKEKTISYFQKSVNKSDEKLFLKKTSQCLIDLDVQTRIQCIFIIKQGAQFVIMKMRLVVIVSINIKVYVGVLVVVVIVKLMEEYKS